MVRHYFKWLKVTEINFSCKMLLGIDRTLHRAQKKEKDYDAIEIGKNSNPRRSLRVTRRLPARPVLAS
jgi:hypothetical protein